MVPAFPDPWFSEVPIKRLQLGHGFSPAAARAAVEELTDSGRYASVRVEVEILGESVGLRLVVVPRRLVRSARVVGGALGQSETLQAAGVRLPVDITRADLAAIAGRVVGFYANRAYHDAKVEVSAVDTDQPGQVHLLVVVDPGSRNFVHELKFEVWPRWTPELRAELAHYQAAAGSPADEVELDRADSALANSLRQRGWHEASVKHVVQQLPTGPRLILRVGAGPRYRVRFEGLRNFDADQLLAFLDLPKLDDRSPLSLERRIRQYYVARGFFDVEVRHELRGAPETDDIDLVFRVHERERLRVVAREFPCIDGPRTPDDIGEEIDGFLSESLPGTDLLGPPDHRALNETLSPERSNQGRATPVALNPWNTYSPSEYERALEHLRKLYRSEGFLSVSVGPIVALRRACDPSRSASSCQPVGERRRPRTQCTASNGLPVEDPPASPEVTCQADSKRRCEPDVVLHIPIKPGPRTYLWDVAFEGNRQLVAEQLAEAGGLDLERPVSQLGLETARKQILELYAEEGFAFATIDVALELSQDRTRAQAKFSIRERERVRVSDIIVRGAERTHEGIILARVAFTRGDYYQRSLVRKTEERLATLGVFASVSVDLLDPEVPGRDKIVVIAVQERVSQRVETRAGFSTGEGIRLGFEYGHRNLAQRAIEFSFTLQGGFLPDALILDDDVRDNFDQLDLIDRIERRITGLLGFPDVGLGPLYRLNLQGVDVYDLARDFALAREAVIFTLIYRPTTRFSAQFGGSLEVNDAEILSEEQGLEDYLLANPDNAALRRLLNVPEGRTFAIAQNTGFTWDRRDNPLGATSGTLLSFNAEHVNGFPAPGNPESLTSHFMRYTNRVAGYVRLSQGGLALAGSFGWGFNQQLRQGSQTYPDRLFFMGGIDSLRGFLQDSLIPQDLAERIVPPSLSDPNPLTVNEVTIRGGDVMINPRLELRIPLIGAVQTALFADTGNLWFDASRFNPWVLRYTAGTGLRLATPLGPLVADYGFNLDRRAWETVGAFHLTLGLF